MDNETIFFLSFIFIQANFFYFNLLIFWSENTVAMYYENLLTTENGNLGF